MKKYKDDKDKNQYIICTLEKISLKLEGKQRESANYIIASLRKNKNNNCGDEDILSIMKFSFHKILNMMTFERYILISNMQLLQEKDKRLQSCDLDNIQNRICLSRNKLFFLNKAKQLKQKMKDIEKSATYETDLNIYMAQKQEVSGNLKLKITSILTDPIFDDINLEIYLDSILISVEELSCENNLNLVFKNSKLIELVLKSGKSVVGLFYEYCDFFSKEYEGKKSIVNICFSEFNVISFEILFEKSMKIIKKEAKFQYKDILGHKLRIYENPIVVFCSICNEKCYFGKTYSCIECNFQCHIVCSSYILFRCFFDNTDDQSKKKYCINYNISHKISETFSNDMLFCYHCGIFIENKIEMCLYCNQTFHERCKPFIFSSCNLLLDLRRKLSNFKPKSEEMAIRRPEDFIIKKLLGSGTFSKVYLAYDKNKKKRCCP